jgi:hypothetical protein
VEAVPAAAVAAGEADAAGEDAADAAEDRPMQTPKLSLGLGIGWRPELARAIEKRGDLGFVEITAENYFVRQATTPVIPKPLHDLRGRGLQVIPHGISLSLGGAEPIGLDRVRRLEILAREFDSPLVSEHIAFVRAGDVEAGHLLPIPRTRPSLEAIVENVLRAQQVLSVPLALENISTLFEWPDAAIPEAEFIAELLERTGCLLLLDVANVYANARNLRSDPAALLDGVPLDRLAYVHMGGGDERDGIYHDTHAGAVPAGAFQLLTELCARVEPPGVMLERDDNFPTIEALTAELDVIALAMKSGRGLRLNRSSAGASHG